MEWSEPTKPNQGCHYDHIECMTPLGMVRIEWKSWKQNEDLEIYVNEEHIDYAFTLDGAKEKAKDYLNKKRDELVLFLIGE